LNIGAFFPLLFIAAEELPGGVAATLAAIQPLVVALLAVVVLAEPPSWGRILWGLAGVAGVALVVLGPGAALSLLGGVAGLLGAGRAPVVGSLPVGCGRGGRRRSGGPGTGGGSQPARRRGRCAGRVGHGPRHRAHQALGTAGGGRPDGLRRLAAHCRWAGDAVADRCVRRCSCQDRRPCHRWVPMARAARRAARLLAVVPRYRTTAGDCHRIAGAALPADRGGAGNGRPRRALHSGPGTGIRTGTDRLDGRSAARSPDGSRQHPETHA